MEPLENSLRDRSDSEVISRPPKSATHVTQPFRQRDSSAVNGVATSAIVLGELCIDRNTIDGLPIAPSWGSPSLFIARWLMERRGHDVRVSGAHGSDLVPLIGTFPRTHEAKGQRSLCYRNVVATVPGVDASQTRTQYWRPADRALQPIARSAVRQAADLLYFCPIVPNADRAEDIRAISEARRPGQTTLVLVAQGLMRSSGPDVGDGFREVLPRAISDDEAAGWSCFDLVIFSEDDHVDAIETATHWSAHPAARNTGYIVTRGEHGATLCHRGESTHFPVARVTRNWNPVGTRDAFGAALGSEFHRAFTGDRMERLPALKKAVEEANLSASRFVEEARRSQPTNPGGPRRPSSPERARAQPQQYHCRSSS